MVKMNKFQNENDLEESDKAALGFRATGARGGIFGIRTLLYSPHPPHRTRVTDHRRSHLEPGKCISKSNITRYIRYRFVMKAIM